ERFEQLKARLRQQLVDAATKYDLETGSRAERSWRARLAEQAVDLVELDRAAEALRERVLVATIDGWPAPEDEWPQDFRSRMARYREARSQLIAERSAALNAIRDDMLVYRPGADGKHIYVRSTPLDFGYFVGATYYINYVGVLSPPKGPGGTAVMNRIHE